MELASTALEKGYQKEATFDFHQAAERFYHCALLVLPLYSPKSHRLNFLRSHAEPIAPELAAAWPRDDRTGRRAFELLRQAYVAARCSPQYVITGEQLGWIGERIATLAGLVEKASRERLADG